VAKKSKSVYKVLQAYSKGKPKKTSIGKSKNSRPLNKHKIKGWKKYRRQG
jgi:hypothetical protein